MINSIWRWNIGNTGIMRAVKLKKDDMIGRYGKNE